MIERPILFSDVMVRKLLDGSKTQSRRVVRLPADSGTVHIDPGGTVFGPGPYLKVERATNDGGPTMHPRIYSPYGYPGTQLWVRETWSVMNAARDTVILRGHHERREDGLDIVYRSSEPHEHRGWRPSIFMPRWASRIKLEITEVRIQRLHDISDEDAKAEGVEPYTPPYGHISTEQRVPGPGFERCRLGDQPHRLPFAHLWDKINNRDGRRWADNCLVWALTFKRI